jgi:hypothetical protein
MSKYTDTQDFFDAMRLKRRFDAVTGEMSGEGFADEDINVAMIRSLCGRIGNYDEVCKLVEAVAATWFAAETG